MRRSFRAAVAACAVAGVAVGICGRLLETEGPALALRPGIPTELSPYQLRAYAQVGEYDLFWLGPMVGTKLEVTEAGSQGLFVRYLPAGRPIGDREQRHTTVATYRIAGAYSVARSSGRAPGAVMETLPAGGLAVWRRDRPTNVFLAYPDSPSLIEIFAPDAAMAHRLARSGVLRSLR